jgi:L-asparaginase / beta-aspartyl-peptidase
MSQKFVLAVHGGAGTLKNLHPERIEDFHAGISKALQAGYEVLSCGGTSLDAVQAAVVSMEDYPAFNAGKGSVCASDGNHYLDASIMTGSVPVNAIGDAQLRSGAVSGSRTTKNPILLARLIKEVSPHTLLIGEHADYFAKEHGLLQVENSYFATDYRRRQLEIARTHDSIVQDHDLESDDERSKKGTVGAVACDQNGRLAAATSTGGRVNQHPGRVGDSAVVGAGTYAEDGVCAVSATGWGEFFLDQSVAAQIALLIRDAGFSFSDALERLVFSRLPKDSGGVIAVNSQYQVSMPYNTGGMIRGSIDQSGAYQIGIHEDMKDLRL